MPYLEAKSVVLSTSTAIHNLVLLRICY